MVAQFTQPRLLSLDKVSSRFLGLGRIFILSGILDFRDKRLFKGECVAQHK